MTDCCLPRTPPRAAASPFSSKFACPVSGARLRRSNRGCFRLTAYGACPHCDSIGARRLYMDPELIVPSENLSMAQGAILPWYSRKHGLHRYARIVMPLPRHFDGCRGILRNRHATLFCTVPVRKRCRCTIPVCYPQTV